MNKSEKQNTVTYLHSPHYQLVFIDISLKIEFRKKSTFFRTYSWYLGAVYFPLNFLAFSKIESCGRTRIRLTLGNILRFFDTIFYGIPWKQTVEKVYLQ